MNEYLGGIPCGEREHCLLGIIPTSLSFLRSKVFYLAAYGTVVGVVSGGKCVALATVITVSWRLGQDLSGSVEVEWLKGQTLRAGCWHAVFMCVHVYGGLKLRCHPTGTTALF